eukprot:Nitzschia sp. Nitz4//scaffold175_size95217//8865//10130//NITZ4_004717-RA/size95217-processed-gene-0.64-mRNA-1//-1//CDS//3329538921//8485//frame0
MRSINFHINTTTHPKGSFLNLTTFLILHILAINTIVFPVPSAHANSLPTTMFPLCATSTFSPTTTTTPDAEASTMIQLEYSVWYPYWDVGSTSVTVPLNDERNPSSTMDDDEPEDPEDQKFHSFLRSVISSIQEFLAHDVVLSNYEYNITVQDWEGLTTSTPPTDDELHTTEVPATNAPSTTDSGIVVRMSGNVFSEEEFTLDTTAPSSDSVRVVTLALESLHIQGHVGEQDENLRWSVWSVTYRIVSIGSLEEMIGTTTKPSLFEEAIAPHQISCISAVANTLQNLLQESLDESIQTGQLELRLQEIVGSTIPLLSVVGAEQPRFEAAWMDFVDQHYGWKNRSRQLRVLGVVMLLFDVAVFVTLTFLSKRRRDAREKYLATTYSHDETSCYDLSTEDGVNDMLFIGKLESRKAMSRNVVV